jgi:uncharacterized Fe-S cluster protein YjdI
MSKRLQRYQAPEIVVTSAPSVCIHSGVCVGGLPTVFDISHKRWVRPELAAPEAVAVQVMRCPSGALQYQWRGRRAETPTSDPPSPRSQP